MGWPKGKPRGPRAKPLVSPSGLPSQEEINAANESADALDKKLGDFAYTKDPGMMEIWEAAGTASPVDVPPNIKKKYPGMRWHWSSERTWDKWGKNHSGWQTFQDKDHPHGVRRGNDLFLTAMPEEMAQARNEKLQLESTYKVRGMVEKAASSELELSDDERFESENAKQRGIPKGMSVGDRPQTRVMLGGKLRTGGGYNRAGLKRSEIHDQIIRERQDRSKRRVYSIPGVNPG